MSELLPRYENSYALVVGIDSYSDGRFVPLGEAESDAQRIAELISKPPHNFMVRTLLGADATKRNILQSMYELRETELDDRVFVYFACHGYTLTDKFGKESGYLAAVDTVPDQDFTAMHMEEVLNLRRHANAKHIAFVFDACFSGQALGLTRSQSVAADKFLTRRSYQVVSAGAGDQTVSDVNSMTSVMIEALEGASATRREVYTLSDLGQYLQETIASESGMMQIPQFGHLRGSQGGDFVFYVESGATLPFEITTVLDSENPHLRWGGVAALIELLEEGETTDEDLLQVARDRLMDIAETEADDRIRQMARHYFDLEEVHHMEDSGKLTPAEAAHRAESVRVQIDAIHEQIRQDTHSEEENIDEVKENLVQCLSEHERRRQQQEGTFDPFATVQNMDIRLPNGALRRWSSVQGQIDSALDQLEDTYDDEARTEKYDEHNAPTMMRIDVEELKAMMDEVDDGWDDRED